MTEEEVKAADLIIKYATPAGITVKKIQMKVGAEEVKQSSLYNAASYLKDEGFIDEDSSSIATGTKLKLIAKGLDFKASRKSYADYLVEKVEKAKKQAIKEDIDREHKELEIRDLKEKLEVTNKEKPKWKTIIGTIIAAMIFLGSIGGFFTDFFSPLIEKVLELFTRSR